MFVFNLYLIGDVNFEMTDTDRYMETLMEIELISLSCRL